MPNVDLMRRALVLIAEVERTGDLGPVLTPEAASAAFRLLAAAAPAPDQNVDFVQLYFALSILWSRGCADRLLNPQAEQDAEMALRLRSILRQHLPDPSILPDLLPGTSETEVDQITQFADLAMLVDSACNALAQELSDQSDATRGPRTQERAYLDQGIDWLLNTLAIVPPGHELYGDLIARSIVLHMVRFYRFAEPDSLAWAADAAVGACKHLSPDHPTQGPNLPLLLDVIGQSATWLGKPALEEVEALAASRGITPLPETVEGFTTLRAVQLQAEAGAPFELDHAILVMLCAMAASTGTLPHLACAAERLRAAVDALPVGDGGRAALIPVLYDAFERLGWDTAPLPKRRSDLAIQLEVPRFFKALRSRGQSRRSELGTAVDRILALGEELALSRGLADGLPAEARAAIAFADCLGAFVSYPEDPGYRPLDRAARHRGAFDALADDDPFAPGYGVICAALVTADSEALASSDPGQSTLLADWARQVIERLERISSPDFPPLRRLRARMPGAALVSGLAALPVEPSADTAAALEAIGSRDLVYILNALPTCARIAREAMDDDTKTVGAIVGMIARIARGSGSLEADVHDFAGLFASTGPEEGLRANLVGLGSEMLARRMAGPAADQVDLGTLTRLAELLRTAHESSENQSPEVATRLVEVLTLMGLLSHDANHLIRAGALHYDTTTAAGPASPGMSATETFDDALQQATNMMFEYIFAHDPARLESALRSIPELVELGERADAEQPDTAGQNRLRAEILRNHLDTLGPGGGPKHGITDEVVDRCRETYRNLPEGELKEEAAGPFFAAVMVRSNDTREQDVEIGVRLLEEAIELTGTSAGDMTQQYNANLRHFLALHRGDDNPPDYVPVLPRHPALPNVDVPVISVPKAIQAAASKELSATNDAERVQATVGVLHNRQVPAWYRVHKGIMAAKYAAALGPTGIDDALLYLAETVALMARLTDRGGTDRTAETALIAFDGAVRAISTEIVVNALPAKTAEQEDAIKRQIAKVQAIAQEAREAGAANAASPEEQRRRLLPHVGVMIDLMRPVRYVSGPAIDSVIELHEWGRGLLLKRRLESRADLSPLRAAHPKLAARFEELTRRLETGIGQGTGRSRVEGLEASEELDRLIEGIRAKPGFKEFLGSLPPARLRELASQGPIIVLNHAAEMPCTAFIVTPERITAIVLDVMAQDVTEAAHRINGAIDAIYARGRRRPAPADLIRAREELTATLAWTWHEIIDPVFKQLGLHEPTEPGAPWPRVWWVPTGPFNAIPLQSAQCTQENCEEGDCGSALDYAVASTIPGFQTLAYARARTQRTLSDVGADRALIVSESDDVLPGAASAAASSAAAYRAADLLVGADADRTTVLGALHRAQWVQFSCHAHSSADRPAGSWIELPSGEALSVQDICRTRPDSARLAVLTACGTARAAERLADEAVHVTSAFLLAGYPEAVGTLWEVDSTRIGAFLSGFYARALGGSPSAAYAVHETVRELRDRAPQNPHVWAAYIHAGA